MFIERTANYMNEMNIVRWWDFNMCVRLDCWWWQFFSFYIYWNLVRNIWEIGQIRLKCVQRTTYSVQCAAYIVFSLVAFSSLLNLCSVCAHIDIIRLLVVMVMLLLPPKSKDVRLILFYSRIVRKNQFVAFDSKINFLKNLFLSFGLDKRDTKCQLPIQSKRVRYTIYTLYFM